jgi:threonine dehydratase
VISKKDIVSASRRIAPHIHRTPVLTSRSLNEFFKNELFFKAENFQKGGAFKIRGACNTIFSLSSKEIVNGVATHSSGNHAQAVAIAASLRKVPAYIVMPGASPQVKKAATKSYGAQITFCENNLKSRVGTLEKILNRTGAELIHPYDDDRIIAGQATVAKELLEDIPGLDFIFSPVGGGGLASGTCLSATYFSRSTRVIGVEPEGADDAFRSLKQGKVMENKKAVTIADGLRGQLSLRTFKILQSHISKIVTVKDEAISAAMKLLWERMKIVVEPSGAIVLAALLENKLKIKGKRVGLILSGGNVDFCSH